jgi:hypothetical protein
MLIGRGSYALTRLSLPTVAYDMFVKNNAANDNFNNSIYNFKFFFECFEILYEIFEKKIKFCKILTVFAI